MTIGLIVAVVAAVVFAVKSELAAMAYQRLLKSHDRERDAWTAERRELLNRIQRPEIVQHTAVADFPTPEPEPDDIGLVGSIRHDPDYEFDSTLADALTEAAFPTKG